MTLQLNLETSAITVSNVPFLVQFPHYWVGHKAMATKFWCWCLHFYDKPVLRLLEDRARDTPLKAGIPQEESNPVRVPEIAIALNRDPRRVYKSLLRLERQARVYELQSGGWCLDHQNSDPLPERHNPRVSLK